MDYEKEIKRLSEAQDQLLNTVMELLDITQQLTLEISMIKDKLGLGEVN